MLWRRKILLAENAPEHRYAETLSYLKTPTIKSNIYYIHIIEAKNPENLPESFVQIRKWLKRKQQAR